MKLLKKSLFALLISTLAFSCSESDSTSIDKEEIDEELVGDSNVPPYYPIDFEADGFGASWTWTVFENDDDPAVEFVENPDKTGINTSATVAKITARRNGADHAGCETKHGTDIGGFTFDENNKTVKIMVYKSVKSDVGLKFAEYNGEAQPEIKVANTKINEWEELTFDLSGSIGKGITKVVDQIIVFPDFRNRSSESIVYFDNITFGN
jgi:hypothetical protein